MKNKKGSHVEVVLSFVLFVSSIFFIYFLSEPSLRIDSKPIGLLSLREKIKNMSSEDLRGVSFVINASNPANCVELINFFNRVGVGENFIVLGESEVINGKKQGNSLFLERKNNLFFKVYGSSEFPPQTGTISGCQQLFERNYSLGLIKTEKKIFDVKILNLINQHKTNYSGLKSELKLPKNINFGLDFVYANGTLVSTQETIPNVNVYSEQLPIQYVNKNSGVEAGKLILRVW